MTHVGSDGAAMRLLFTKPAALIRLGCAKGPCRTTHVGLATTRLGEWRYTTRSWYHERLVASFSEHTALAHVLGTSSEAILVWEGDRRVSAWSRAAQELFGWSEQQALGVASRELFASGPLAASTASQALLDGEFDATILHRAGGQVETRLRLSVIRDAEGKELGGVACVRATKEAASNEASEASAAAERLNLALSAARLGDWSWDVSTDVVTLSARAAEIWGIPPGPHRTWAELRQALHPDDRERAQLAVTRALADHGVYSIEYRVLRGEQERWVFASGHGRYGPDGAPLGMLGVVQDITSDRLLVRVDNAVRTLVDSEDITYTAARVLGQHLNVNRCAYAFVEDDQDTFSLTGNYTHEVSSIVGRYRFRQFGAECLRSMRAGEPYVVEDSARDPRLDEDDRRAYVLTEIRAVICVPILKAGKFVAAMAVHTRAPRRFTAAEVELVQQVASRCWESIERARVERERGKLLEAAEAANRAKDEFLAMLGHELRNPLAPIATALQVMRLRGDGSSQRERTLIERQVSHLTRLVDDLLDVSRIAQAKVVLKFERLELSDIVRRAIEVASPLLEQRAHTLELNVPLVGLAVDGDAARLTQVVSNLLTNAGKYTPPGGRIEIWGQVDEELVVLRVRDTGVGIPADVLPRIFELFVQGRQTIERAQGGLGLGLSIVRSLVERHGGSVTAFSAGAGQGSEFVVSLPKAKARNTSPDSALTPRPQAEPSPAAGMRILVVDDNEDAAEMLASAMAMRGSEVHVAHDGPRALGLAAAQPFDAALLDIGLPIMDGYELAQRLRELPTFQRAKLIAVTGYGQESDRRRALAAGFDHHMVKPVDFQALENIVTNLVRGQPMPASLDLPAL